MQTGLTPSADEDQVIRCKTPQQLLYGPFDVNIFTTKLDLFREPLMASYFIHLKTCLVPQS